MHESVSRGRLHVGSDTMFLRNLLDLPTIFAESGELFREVVHIMLIVDIGLPMSAPPCRNAAGRF